VAGQLLSLAALLYLQGPTAALGLLLGLATTVTACLGVSGCVLRHTGHLAGHIVGGVLLSSLAVGYVAQVGALWASAACRAARQNACLPAVGPVR
jgi:hypothetical protein